MISYSFRITPLHEDLNLTKRLVFGLVMLFGANTLLYAEASPQNSNDQILALSRHISEFQEHHLEKEKREHIRCSSTFMSKKKQQKF